MKATPFLKLSFIAGDDIKSCFEEAIRIAKILNVTVEFDFNGVSCYAAKYSTPEKGVKAYHEAINKDRFKMAFAHGKWYNDKPE